MASICFYFQVHQPYRIKKYRIFDVGHDHEYFNDRSDRDINNEKILHKVAGKCYLPTNKLMLELLEKHPEFKIAYSFSGVFLDQLEEFSPETLISFQKLVKTGRVEILDETYYHSLSFLYSKDEFVRQVELHRAKVKKLFGVTPKVFRNTELIYNNELAKYVEEMGYKAILAEGADHLLGWRSPNFVYKSPGTTSIKTLLKNYKLSDDIAFRFSSKSWEEWPLTSEKFTQWVNNVNGNGNVVNLFMDYETFGEHQWEDTGIFDFMRALPGEILKHPDNEFLTPSEVADKYEAVGEFDAHNYVSWADVERDLSAWLSNTMQHEAINNIYALEADVFATGDVKIIEDWRKLQTSDHFYYMCTKWFSDGDVHKYFNPYDTPYEAFIAYNNVIHDLRLRIEEKKNKRVESKKLSVAKKKTTPAKKAVVKVAKTVSAPKKKVAVKKHSVTKK
ncbi:MAG: alpha-amylase [Candidatus Lloydbacteria bacterium RIFCSPHIGHO2_01_FULL_49_22]|uniref:Alpha-amylase n=1 Tax=Candidatus Lloydbacteria bacterium RIFCSPHIGHO2_01_FULL_49_22 TaxID=1798658 RepID=A0A1G2CU96_9BACT|nr:MAG: alpha-amylase [Candidatus Lloydbacteria bacterium RIFCSPHIGHO2_01_FULL_49_22]OGZ08889.1 MAG: alpha-amylase [Candidatus Lloydbacteria bacterium RIFCSPHIGHO2_02_FULL_50_18]